jgi:hypothetical protein
MKKLTGLFAGYCVVVCGLLAGVEAVAQEMPPPPKVLVIMREFLKPGRAGGVHERSESAFVRAMTAAKWPTHYFAVESMSGPSRALFLTGYPSFAAWEKDNQATAKNAALTAALEHAALMDGDLLTSYDQNVLVYRDDISLRSNALVNLASVFIGMKMATIPPLFAPNALSKTAHFASGTAFSYPSLYIFAKSPHSLLMSGTNLKEQYLEVPHMGDINASLMTRSLATRWARTA